MNNIQNSGGSLIENAVKQLQQQKLATQKRLNKDRVMDFEQELRSRIEGLTSIEKDILSLSTHRQNWLESLSKTENYVADLYFRKIEILKAHAELSALKMTEDILHLEAQYEAQVLNFLVESTKPFDLDESEVERDAHLERVARKDGEALQVVLGQHIETRAKLSAFNYELSAELTKMMDEIPVLQKAQADEMKEKIAQYVFKMEESKTKSKENNRKVTSEYLVLRHNSRAAKEVLSRSKNDAAAARVQLQKCLDQIIAEASEKKDRTESLAMIELNNVGETMRAEAVKREVELEQITERVNVLRRERKGHIKSLAREVSFYDKKYNELQRKRKKDIVSINSELKRLRGMIQELELKLVLSSSSSSSDAVRIPSEHVSSTSRVRPNNNNSSSKDGVISVGNGGRPRGASPVTSAVRNTASSSGRRGSAGNTDSGTGRKLVSKRNSKEAEHAISSTRTEMRRLDQCSSVDSARDLAQAHHVFLLSAINSKMKDLALR